MKPSSVKIASFSIVRIIVGVLFIFSGLIKANDPLGLSYKMQEFFEVWHLPGFDPYTLWLSVLMIVFEIVAGVAVLLGWRMKLFSWLLLLLIIFFAFLTGYAVLSGKIKECGCFGDCIPLQAMGSFIKDLFLFVLILYLFVNRQWISTTWSSRTCIAVLGMTIIFSCSFQWYTLHYLPVLDCLAYKKGVNISEKMKPPVGAIPDSTVISFVYQKNGKHVEYTADKLPADFDDSYTFIKRYDKLIRKGNADPSIKDFTLTTVSGNDSTMDILNQPGYKIFIFSRHFRGDGDQGSIGTLYTMAKSRQIPVYIITSSRPEADAFLQTNGLAAMIPVFGCDATAVKTAARVDPTFYLLKKSTIVKKWSPATLDLSLIDLLSLPTQTKE